MLGLPMLVPALPAGLPPLATEIGAHGRRRREGVNTITEEELATALKKLLVAIAKYSDF